MRTAVPVTSVSRGVKVIRNSAFVEITGKSAVEITPNGSVTGVP